MSHLMHARYTYVHLDAVDRVLRYLKSRLPKLLYPLISFKVIQITHQSFLVTISNNQNILDQNPVHEWGCKLDPSTNRY